MEGLDKVEKYKQRSSENIQLQDKEGALTGFNVVLRFYVQYTFTHMVVIQAVNYRVGDHVNYN